MNNEELSVLEYARSNLLCRDYTSESILSALEIPLADPGSVGQVDFDDCTLPPILSSENILINDRWSIDRSSASFLRDSLTSNVQSPSNNDLVSRQRREWRLECPVLFSDEVLDLRIFQAESTRERPSLDKLAKSLQPEPLIDTAALDWQLLREDLVERCTRIATSKPLQIDATSLGLLRDSVQAQAPTERDYGADITRSSLLRMSPPLLSLSPASFSSSIATEAFDLPLTSTPVDPANASVEEIDAYILQESTDPARHTFVAQELPTEATQSLMYLGAEPVYNDLYPSSSPRKRLRSEELKIESPLLPEETPNPPDKRVRFDEVIVKDDSLYCPQSSPSVDDDFDQTFQDLVDLSRPAINVLENEQLHEADTLKRMPVPSLQPCEPVVPWDMPEQPSKPADVFENPTRNPFYTSIDALIAAHPAWPHTGAERKLRWNPIPHVRQDDMVSDTMDSQALNTLTASSTLEQCSLDGCFWKPDGLRILDLLQDEELEAGLYNREELDIATLAYEKRPQPASPLLMSTLRKRALQTLQGSTSMLGANSALSSFLQLHTGRPRQDLYTDNAPVSQSLQQPITPPIVLPAQLESPIISFTSQPALAINPEKAPTHILISSTLLPERTFVAGLRRLLPGTVFIERDLALNEETDLIIRPSTGVILTTLQKIKQRALPGSTETGGSGVHVRVATLKPRYEKLIVLVSEGLPCSSAPETGEATRRGLDASDAAAVNDLVVLGANLGGGVEVAFVPGGETALVQWTVGKACEAGQAAAALSFGRADGMGEETAQEVWLRQAGLNAFAAAAVLAASSHVGRPGMSLARFVNMSHAERTRVFGPVVGFDTIEKIHSVVDQKWLAAGAARSDIGVQFTDDYEGDAMLL